MSAPAEAELPAESIEHLASARSWARFLAVFGFIGSALMLLGIAVTAAMPPTSELPKAATIGAFLGALATLMVFSVVLWSYSSALHAFSAGRPGALVAAFRRLRVFWILLVLGYVGSTLFALLVLVRKVFSPGSVP